LTDKVISSDFNGFASLAIAAVLSKTLAKECHKNGFWSENNPSLSQGNVQSSPRGENSGLRAVKLL
jgi:hypothetical protein